VGAFLPPPGQPDPKMDPKFRSTTIPNLTTFSFDGIDPPAGLYVTRDDIIFLNVFSTIAAESVTFTGRFLRVDYPGGGQPDSGPAVFTPPAVKATATIIAPSLVLPVPGARAFATGKFQLGEGFLLSMIANPTLATHRGQTFVVAAINRGIASADPAKEYLFQDYCTQTNSAVWPGGRFLNSIEGPGFKHSIQQANPAAGADWTFTLLANQRLRLETLSAQLAAANAGVARAVELIVDDGANILLRVAANVTQAINTTAQYTVGALSTPSTIVTTDMTINVPTPMILEPGWRIRTNTVNINAADQWSAIWLNVEEWFEF
jgi:hypothetical protein